jgi:ubiquinone biosynthesis accessory factor UbiJ
VETALNAYLRLDPETLNRLGRLSGRVIGIELHGFGLTFYVLPGADGVQVLGEYEGEPDAVLSGAPLGLLRLGLGRGDLRPLFAGEVEIRGDVDVGRGFKDALDRIEIDWEEQLSHVVGDVVAHQMGRLARGVVAWGRSSADTLARDLGEYLQEERRELPAAAEVEEFLDSVDRLRTDADRLEARVRRLQRRLAQHATAQDPPQNP